MAWVATPERATSANRALTIPRSVPLEAAGLLAVLALALLLRLIGIAADTDIADEGIRAIQLRLMAAGFWPVRDVYAAQGPLSLPATFPLYVLLGGDIVAARLAVVVYSIAGIIAMYAAGRLLGGPGPGLVAAGLLAASPAYLESSRLALVEIPSLLPGLLAILALLKYRTSRSRRWLIASSALFAVACLIKPMVAPLGAAALVLLAARAGGTGGDTPRGRAADLIVYGAVGLLVVAAAILVIGPSQVYEQIVDYRLGARAAGRFDSAGNWTLLRAELGREGLGLLAAAALGAIVLARRRPLEAAAIIAWLGASLLLLLLYSPLRPKHAVYLLPPLVLLAGAGIGSAAQAARDFWMRRSARPADGLALAALTAYLVALPTVTEADRAILTRPAPDDPLRFGDDLRVVAAATGPGEFVVMDDAYLAALSARLLPPHMADLSYTRILARTLSSTRAKHETEAHAAGVVQVQDDHLGQLPRYVEWLDRNYVLVKSYVRRVPRRYRRVYVRPDADLAAVRTALIAAIDTPTRAALGPVGLLGYGIDRREARAGELFWLTLHLEAEADSPPEHDLVVRLRAQDGRAVQQTQVPVGDGDQRLQSWAAGRWQFQTLQVQVDRRTWPGTYRLTLGLERSSDRPAAVRGDQVVPASATGTELELGAVRVR